MAWHNLGQSLSHPQEFELKNVENLTSGVKGGHDFESGSERLKLYVLEPPLTCGQTQ